MSNDQNSPIDVLEHNVTWALENATPYAGRRLADAVANELVCPEIGLNCDSTTAPPMGPFLYRPGNAGIPEMHIGLKHLELLWSFTYSWMVIYERGILTSPVEKTWDDHADISDPVLLRAICLRDWSASLQFRCTPWPEDLPSPCNYSNDIEEWYGGKANLVFQQAAAFLLGHEFAHAIGGHLDFAPADSPDCDAIEAENDADSAAFASIVEGIDDETEKLSKAWSILSAILSTIYLGKAVRTSFVQKRHPPVHHRLSNFLRMLDFKGEQYRYYFPTLACVVLNFALDELASIPRSASRYEDADELFDDTLNRIDRWIGTR